MLTPKEIFAELLATENGELIKVQCFTHEEAESVRTSLYRERTKLRTLDPDTADSIVIRRGKEENFFVVTVKKASLTAKIIKVGKDGEEEILQKDPAENHPELLRGMKLMKDAGADEEDVALYKEQWLKEYTDALLNKEG